MSKEKTYPAIQVFTAVTAMVGAFLAGLMDTKMQLIGFVFFLMSNSTAVFLFCKKKMWVLVAQQSVFTALSINGIIQRVI